MFVGNKATVKEENFLASARFTSFSTMVDDTNAAVTTDELGHKVIPAGTIWPSNDAKAKGIIYREMNVNEGPQMAALIVDGWIIGKNLPVVPTAEAMAAMTAVKFKDKDALTTTTTDSGTTSQGSN